MRSSAAVIAASCALCACAAERKIVVTSEPAGALVRLDGDIVGTTPFEARFDAYGTRRITLYKDGYRTGSRIEVIEPPWYAAFPIDFFTEVLVPIGWKDIRPVHLKLEPVTGEITAPDVEAVIERARALRMAEPTGPRQVRELADEAAAGEDRR